ncbi:acylphosphatase [Candidatus Micrarchaeota archaeon]|nr:acylphosphatase [Candidatus Micrarchaeota archaeon]
MKRRATSIVRGRVQGVGYRDRVLEKALELGIAGFVENEPDGSVKVVCEAEEGVLQKFPSSIEIKHEPDKGIILVKSV